MTFSYPFSITSNLIVPRIEDTQPAKYQLMKKLDGTLVLQGFFRWTDGRETGGDWKDIETVEEQPILSVN